MEPAPAANNTGFVWPRCYVRRVVGSCDLCVVVNYAFAELPDIEVYRLADASFVGWMGPDEAVGDIGIIDITHGLKAIWSANGEYVVFLEEGAKARTLVYRWRP